MTEKKFKVFIRTVAIQAASLVVTNKDGDAMNLLTEAKTIYNWLYEGKDPVVEQTG